MEIKQNLSLELKRILRELKLNATDLNPVIEYPKEEKNGDFTTNIAMQCYRELAKALDTHVDEINWASKSGLYNNPFDVANAIKAKLESNMPDYLEKVEVVSPGFINFWLSDKYYSEYINKISESNILAELKDLNKHKKVVIEYSSPNIAKPFTIGHLRSTIIGEVIANLLEATGWKVYRDNHIGDWGTQFGKQIYAIKNIRLPYVTYIEGENIGNRNEQEIENSLRPVKVLVDLYVLFHEQAKDNPEMEEKAREWFKKLEDGDTEARSLWNACIDWSWKEFNKIYDALDVRFSENKGEGYGESFFEDKMGAVLDELKNKPFYKVGENGAKLVFFPHDELPPLMILKKDGATLYSTRDLATDKFRLSHYGEDITVINEVGAEQSLYFRQLYKLEEMLGWYKKQQRIHIKHGLYKFKDGKMSTRKGNVIWLEDVLEEAKRRALFLKSNKQEKPTKLTATTALERTPLEKRDGVISANDHFENVEPIAIGAIKWNDLKRNPEQDIAFDWDEILNMQGNSGPYLQYTYVRTRSVIARSEATKQSEKADTRLPHASVEAFAMTNNLAPEERNLLRLLARYPEVVADAASRYSPNVLCSYLFEVAQSFNSFYQKHQIVKAPEKSRDFRISLTAAAGKTLQSGLQLLGIKAPEKM